MAGAKGHRGFSARRRHPTVAFQRWKEIHDRKPRIFRRGVVAGVFIDDNPAYPAKLYSAMDQVPLSDWVVGGMKAGQAQLAQRFQLLVERAFCRK